MEVISQRPSISCIRAAADSTPEGIGLTRGNGHRVRAARAWLHLEGLGNYRSVKSFQGSDQPEK
jgi:hypothetical protein